jgi:hypothetical protein
MKKSLVLWIVTAALCSSLLHAQEADSGVNLRAILTGQGMVSNLLTEPPRSGSVATAGFNGVFYPTWKLSDHWTAFAAWQLYTRPYYIAGFTDAGYGATGDLLQASLNYSRVSQKGSVLVRAGQLSSSFGSFPLRYDSVANPLVDLPLEYGYYYNPVTVLGLAGAQVDATRGKFDGRAQFTNSSPANPRTLFDRDQYGNWATGGGYTIRQGLRVGGSWYRGPYLDRQYAYFFPGEENPNRLPANAWGIDASWARGHWNLQGEVQRFVLPYTAIPTLVQQPGYVEFKRVLSPRWYVAARAGYNRTYGHGHALSDEASAGYSLSRFELIKFDYEYEDYSTAKYPNANTLSVQFVTILNFSAAR